MNEAVDRGDGYGRIGEDLSPFREGLIAGYDERAALVALGDELTPSDGSRPAATRSELNSQRRSPDRGPPRRLTASARRNGRIGPVKRWE